MKFWNNLFDKNLIKKKSIGKITIILKIREIDYEIIRHFLKQKWNISIRNFKNYIRNFYMPSIARVLKSEQLVSKYNLVKLEIILDLSSPKNGMEVRAPLANGSGQIFMNPYFIFEEKSFLSIEKFEIHFSHEIVHLFDKKAHRMDGKYDSYEYGLAKLYLKLLKQCRIEGIAELNSCKNRSILIEAWLVRNFNKNLINHMSEGDTAEDFRETLRWAQNDFVIRNFPYRLGLCICAIISLALITKEGSISEIFLYDEQNKSTNVDKINSYFELESFHVSMIPESSFQKALHFIIRMDDERFIRTYNISCNLLGISKNHRVITQEQYNKFRKSLKNK